MARDIIAVRRPTVGQRIRLGETVRLQADLTVARPWFRPPSFGHRVRTITGQSRRGLDFEVSGERPVLSLTAGRATCRDSGRDCYAKSDTIGAKLGCCVVVTSGDLTLTYANLKRGSARSGSVRVGERLGYAGNTGHCLDGERKRFVHFELNQGATPREPDAYEESLDLVALVDGRAVTKPVAVPEGEIEIAGLDLGGFVLDGREYRVGACEVAVALREGSRTRATGKITFEIVR